MGTCPKVNNVYKMNLQASSFYPLKVRFSLYVWFMMSVYYGGLAHAITLFRKQVTVNKRVFMMLDAVHSGMGTKPPHSFGKVTPPSHVI